MSPSVRHFISLDDLSSAELRQVLDRARHLKAANARGERVLTLQNRVLGMIFEKASTRTRVSFEAGMAQLGGHAIFLSPRDTQLGRGEPIADSARVLSRMVDIIMIRAHHHADLVEFAAHSRVPVINALTDLNHPCQLLADMMTFEEHRGDIRGKTVAWVGDGFNMCHSYINAARVFGFRLNVATPVGYAPDPKVVAESDGLITLTDDPRIACKDADLVVTDVWTSMGQEEESVRRLKDFEGYCVSESMMALARPDALFMHCLPAHRGEEVDAAVIDGPKSVVWDEAENRLHTQKALLEFLLGALH
ncbi:MAG: ornithine carbamoyltransferase [Halothiobacillaceae bacterium]|jgi:ornithine carbamoyltransferase|nr:MAG: ornithine carbamoyltransferase [Halothiobacillaceae bacterium]